MKTINIPFPGFYCSRYSGAVDTEETQTAENMEEQALGLEAWQYASLLYDCANYAYVFEQIAKHYADCFSAYIEEETGLYLGLEFEEMTSPREYNFTTDRVFAKTSIASVYEMYRRTSLEALTAAVKERHSSRDGFISFYPNQLIDWPPALEDWDANHLGTLLAAFTGEHLDADWEWDIYDKVTDMGFVGQTYDACVNWTRFEELKAEKLAELEAEHE